MNIFVQLSAAKAVQNIPSDKCAAIAGKFADAEALIAMKDLVNRLGSDHLATEQNFPQDGASIDLRSNYLLNNTIARIEEADVVLLIGTNPRYEAPLVNTRLRKGYLHGEQNIGLIGPKIDLTYDYEVRMANFLRSFTVEIYLFFLQHLGQSLEAISQLKSGSHKFSATLKNAKKPLIILGSDQLTRKDGARILSEVQELSKILSDDCKVWTVHKIQYANL